MFKNRHIIIDYTKKGIYNQIVFRRTKEEILERKEVNLIYVKTVLYCYPCLEAVISQIDELVEKRAFSSMWDFSPAIYQCERISNLTCQKVVMIDLKKKIDKVLERFDKESIDHFEYKFFRRKNKEYFKDFDYKSRKYFRTQNKLVKEFGLRLEKVGVDDIYFEEYLIKIEFFKELLRRVREHEIISRKNKTEQEKQREKRLIFSTRDGKNLIEKENKKVLRSFYS